MRKSFLLWLHGLVAVFIGAFASSIVTTYVAPEAFNFTTQWKRTATVALAMGIVQAAAYLAKSPLPEIPTTTESKS